MIPALVYLLTILFAETITVYGHPVWGVWCHVIVFTGLIIHSAITRNQSVRRILLSLSLAPLVRIISLSMPLGNVPQIWWYPIIYTPLLAAALVVIRLLRLRREEIGITAGFLPVQLGIALTGIGLGLVEYFILKPAPLVEELTWQSVWLPSLIFLFAVGLVEELIFRGVMQRCVTLSWRWKGIFYISLLFAILHMGFFSWLDVVFVFGIAVFFGWMVNKTGSLLGVTLSHGLANIVLYLIAPFLLG
jgi:membrane protease YdiL (CAAX protease family)